MTKEEVIEQHQATIKIQFQQNARMRAIDVANSYGRTSDNPLTPRGKSIESLLADADKIYKWLISEKE